MRASKRRRILAVLALVIAVPACDTPTGAAPGPTFDGSPNLAIGDAAHGGAAGFYFLPPTIRKPKSFAGSFDATLSPVVRICRWVGEACDGPDIVIDGSGNGEQRVKLKGQSYGAIWQDTDALAVGDVYRLRVYAAASATVPLGFADLLIVERNSDEKHVPEEFIGVARGLPFPIRFRIEEGATTPPGDDVAPAVTATTPAADAAEVARNANLSITFSEPVNVSGDWFTISCTATGTRVPASTTVSGGPTMFTIDPNADFAVGESCTVTIVAALVTDQDADDPPDNMTADDTFEFTVVPVTAPTPVDDGPVANTVPGDPFHAHLDVPIVVPAPGLLANDELGVPAGAIVSFGGGSLGGSVTSHAAGETVMFGDVGELTVLASGAFAFRPTTGFNGTFTFQYRVGNENGSSHATVTIFVGERPPDPM